MLPLVYPIGIAALAGIGWLVNSRRDPPPITPAVAAQRAIVFDTAMNTPQSTETLRALRDEFLKQGQTAEATMLDKRIALREAPAELQAARKETFQKAMKSKDPAVIREFADCCEEIGAVGAAISLREYAAGVEQALANAHETANTNLDAGVAYPSEQAVIRAAQEAAQIAGNDD